MADKSGNGVAFYVYVPAFHTIIANEKKEMSGCLVSHKFSMDESGTC